MDLIYEDMQNFIQQENKKLGKKNKKSIEELSMKYINTKIIDQSMNNQEEDSEDSEENNIKNNNTIILEENFKKYQKSIQKEELETLLKESEKI